MHFEKLCTLNRPRQKEFCEVAQKVNNSNKIFCHVQWRPQYCFEGGAVLKVSIIPKFYNQIMLPNNFALQANFDTKIHTFSACTSAQQLVEIGANATQAKTQGWSATNGCL